MPRKTNAEYTDRIREICETQLAKIKKADIAELALHGPVYFPSARWETALAGWILTVTLQDNDAESGDICVAVPVMGMRRDDRTFRQAVKCALSLARGLQK